MRESFLWLLRDARNARRQGPAAIERRQRTRLSEIVAFARAQSPYYREIYRDLPEKLEDPKLLPVTDKKKLMARFDEWVTDRHVTMANVLAFLENPELVGESFAGTYTALTTSGTTGTRGVFLLDDRAMAVTNALFVRLLGAWLGMGDVIRIFAGGGRVAMIMAAGSHFASAVAAARLRKRLKQKLAALPVDMPLPEMVERLNRFQPVLMAPYASMAAILASEQEAGRLRIRPVILVLSAEGLPLHEYDRIAKVFRAKVRHSYAATECPFLSYSCEQKWLHVNSDWVVLEPVDADYQPTPPGQQSHTVLISNLANRVQPILRYDLGDSILQRPDPCPCGNPLPAIRVQGRAADVLTFTTGRGDQVKIAPLALTGEVPGVDQFQIVQTTPTSLRVRLRLAAGADSNRVWRAVHDHLTHVLTGQGLGHVTLEHAEEPPEQSAGGKFREVIPLD